MSTNEAQVPLEDFIFSLMTNETATEKNFTDIGLLMRKHLKIALLRGSLSLDKEFAQLLKENRTERANVAIRAFSDAVSALRDKLVSYGVDPLSTMEKTYGVVYTRDYLDSEPEKQKKMIRDALKNKE